MTGELESRWNSALVRVTDIEKRIAHHDAVAPPPLDVESVSFTTLAADFAAVWAAPSTDVRLKKRIVRTVLEEAVGDIDDDTAEIVLVLHWAGGAHTEHRLPKRRRGQRNSAPSDTVEAVRTLALIAKDEGSPRLYALGPELWIRCAAPAGVMMLDTGTAGHSGCLPQGWRCI